MSNNTTDKIVISNEDLKKIDIIIDVINSYYDRPEDQSDAEWLKEELKKRAEDFINEDERLEDVRQILDTIEIMRNTYNDFREHIDKGYSVESWIASQIEKGAEALGLDASQHAQSIDEAMQKASEELMKVIAPSSVDDLTIKGPQRLPYPFDWNEFTRIDIAKQLKETLLNNAGINVGINVETFNVLAEHAMNTLQSKNNPSFAKDFEDFCKSSLKKAVKKKLCTTVGGGLTIFARTSSNPVLRALPGGVMACLAFDTLDKARILYQSSDGTLSPVEAVDAVANTACCTAGSIFGGSIGASVGGTLGTILGPIGTALGSAAGSAIGTLAGSKICQKIYEGVKKVGSTIGSVVKEGFSVVKECASAIKEGISAVTGRIASFFGF